MKWETKLDRILNDDKKSNSAKIMALENICFTLVPHSIAQNTVWEKVRELRVANHDEYAETIKRLTGTK